MKKLFVLVATLMLGASLSFAQAGGQAPDAGKSDTTKSKKHHHKGGKKSKKSKKGSADSTTPPAK